MVCIEIILLRGVWGGQTVWLVARLILQPGSCFRADSLGVKASLKVNTLVD